MTPTNAQLIHDRTIELLGTVGMRFLHPDALKVLKSHGVKMEGNTAYFSEEEIMKYVEMAPSRFTVHARDPKFDIELGGDQTYIGPLMAAIKIIQTDGSYRLSTLDDLILADKIVEYNDRFHINGGGICVPGDVPEHQFIVFQLYVGLMLSGKIPPDVCGSYETVETCMDIIAASFGCSKEELKETPRLLGGMNVNSPLFLDSSMTETLFTLLKYHQPCYITPAAMAGSTSPIFTAATIVQNNAEVLGTLVLSQMYEPGAPVLYASQSASADMRSLAIATGSPESALCYRYAGIMGDFYDIPVRAGGLLSDAKKMDVQSGYESMLTYLACVEGGVDVVLHGAGHLDAYLGLSFEKLVADFQIIDYADIYLKDIEVNDETVPMEDMKEFSTSSSFVAADSTLDNFSTALLDPIISVRGAKPKDALEKNIENYIEKAVAAYRAPDISEENIQNMRDLLVEYGIDESFITKVEGARVA